MSSLSLEWRFSNSGRIHKFRCTCCDILSWFDEIKWCSKIRLTVEDRYFFLFEIEDKNQHQSINKGKSRSPSSQRREADQPHRHITPPHREKPKKPLNPSMFLLSKLKQTRQLQWSGFWNWAGKLENTELAPGACRNLAVEVAHCRPRHLWHASVSEMLHVSSAGSSSEKASPHSGPCVPHIRVTAPFLD